VRVGATLSRSACWILVAALGSGAPAVAHAAPANVFFVLDTSASMNAPGAEGTQLDDAKAIVAALAAEADAAGHRSALLRFRQRSAIVPGGEGPREVVVEDPEQCARAADVLVPLGGGAGPRITRWVDGVEGQGLDEVEALGDSPLYASARVVLRYVDGLRTLDPRRHCVRALVVIVTDGEDNCAGGAELLEALEELEAAAPSEAIQTLVIARQTDAEAARRLARVGREEEEPRVFGFDEVDAARARLAALDGQAVIPSCGEEGTTEPPVPEVDAGVDAGATAVDAGPCEVVSAGGCSAAGTVGGAWWLFALGLLLRRRREVWLAAAVLVGCGDDDGELRCPTPPDASVTVVDAGVEDAGVEAPDPEVEVRSLQERQAAARALLEEARAAVTPLVEPEAVFDALEGPPREACRALVDTVAYEPYQGFQRGVRGCLATRRCSSGDQTLLLQACLAHHGVETELRQCRFDGALDEVREELESQEPVFPDVSAIDEALRTDAAALLEDLPEVQGAVTTGVESVAEYAMLALDERVEADVAILSGLTEIDPTSSMALAESERDRARGEHYFLLDGEERLDAILETPTDCFEIGAADPLWMTVELLVQNVRLSGTSFGYEAEVSLGSLEFPVHTRVGTPIDVVVTDAGETVAPAGLPAPSEGSAPCFRAFVDGNPTASFPLFASDATACGDDVPEALLEDHGFGRLILRTVVEDPSGLVPHTRDRILVDRFGYARDAADAIANGPSFGAVAAGHLIPMRVRLEVGGGLPGPHEEMHALVSDRLARFDELAGSALEMLTAGSSEGHADLPAFGALTFGLVRRAMPSVLGEDVVLRGPRPWRLASVWRRVFVPGEGIAEKRIFDLLELPWAVHSADADARLEASLRLGALFTEAERLAGMSLEGALRVLHAGELLRDESVAFEPYVRATAGERYPFGLRDAAVERTRAGDELFVTPAPVDVFGTEVLSWWRVDSLGVPTGEIRYEGSLYGGVTAAKAVATFVRCLGLQAIIALTGPRISPSVSCCADLAFRTVVADLVTGWIMTGVTGGIGMAIGATYGEAMGDVAGAVGDGVTTAGDVNGLLDLWRDSPACGEIFDP